MSAIPTIGRKKSPVTNVHEDLVRITEVKAQPEQEQTAKKTKVEEVKPADKAPKSKLEESFNSLTDNGKVPDELLTNMFGF